ncbi:MAG: hypothetical protein KJZ84_16270 [Bryobacteraceae bacterium]|nr:hypothetical protein [Bryobacteraceae bacterium]
MRLLEDQAQRELDVARIDALRIDSTEVHTALRACGSGKLDQIKDVEEPAVQLRRLALEHREVPEQQEIEMFRVAAANYGQIAACSAKRHWRTKQ